MIASKLVIGVLHKLTWLSNYSSFHVLAFRLVNEFCLVYLLRRETMSPSLSVPCLQSSRRLLTSACESIAAIVDIIFAICDDQHTTFHSLNRLPCKNNVQDNSLGDNCLRSLQTSSAARTGHGLERKASEFDQVATATNKH